ncbi:unnamed protein product [Cyclocybe aegerita]|uniref:GmrSD restriction endonucleases C-terminal domain-containing protein n=1 Tax=Cyclocybe aegerita TaxID=1973307 RepID=A0A8S0WCL5_CYCAE|nr:unnamed protein product [Cyclocybe aegerita]
MRLSISLSGNCDTRETVLKRDGTNVVTNSACSATSGHWVSPYDGIVTDLASDLDIDHVVPLKEAWVLGARNWTPAQREAFANDLTPDPSALGSLGDRDPANWLPPLSSYVCTYVCAWVQVKYYYGLTIDSAEKTVLTNMLGGC